MILIDGPYVSDFLKSTLREKQIEVIKTPAAFEYLGEGYNYLEQAEAVKRIKENPLETIFSNSENSISWIEQHLAFSDIPERVKIFKNKVLFRQLISNLYPDYFFQSIALEELSKVDIDSIPFPVVVKPAVGFFSLGVYNVEKKEEWPGVVSAIRKEMEGVTGLFPEEVMDGTTFVIEQHIAGEEYAVDCYFSDTGEPVMLNIMHHLFSSGKDVSDRVYITSGEIIRKNKPVFESFLSKLGELAGLKNFLIHIEIRMDDQGKITPIEVNPMRFGGWCTTADLTRHAYGFNAYEYFSEGLRPDWEQIFEGRSDDLYSVIVLDNGSGIPGEKILSFDYDKLLDDFEKPLVLRKIDYKKFPLFGFVFAQTREDNMDELYKILHSDLREYIQAI